MDVVAVVVDVVVVVVGVVEVVVDEVGYVGEVEVVVGEVGYVGAGTTQIEVVEDELATTPFGVAPTIED